MVKRIILQFLDKQIYRETSELFSFYFVLEVERQWKGSQEFPHAENYKRESFELTGKCGTRIVVWTSVLMKLDFRGWLRAPPPSLDTREGR